MIKKTPPGTPDLIESLRELCESGRQAIREVMELAQRHPTIARQTLVVSGELFQRLFSSFTYRKFWDAYQLWKYRDEQHYYEVDEFGMDEALLEVVKPFFQFLYYEYFRVDVEGDGFLYNTVRNIVGTLIEVGLGRMNPEDIKRILEAKNRSAAGPIAPAAGLCLMWVRY